VTGALFGAETTPLAKIVVELLEPGLLGDLDGIVRADHAAIATVETESASEAALRFADHRFVIQGGIKLLEPFNLV